MKKFTYRALAELISKLPETQKDAEVVRLDLDTEGGFKSLDELCVVEDEIGILPIGTPYLV